jgi:hypothetical protein
LSDLESCSVEHVFGLPTPFYVRKLARKSHWAIDTDDEATRIASVVSNVFSEVDADDDWNDLSFYVVNQDSDLHKIAIGLNSNRSSLREQLDLVAFTADELAACDLVPVSTLGSTACGCTNRLHVDIRVTTETLSNLCRSVFSNSRKSGRLKKNPMQAIIDSLTASNCDAIVGPDPACAFQTV